MTFSDTQTDRPPTSTNVKSRHYLGYRDSSYRVLSQFWTGILVAKRWLRAWYSYSLRCGYSLLFIEFFLAISAAYRMAWQSLRTRAFWLLAIATSLSSGINAMATMFRVPLLIDKGFSHLTITDIFRIVPLMGLAGILLFGYLGDRFPKRYLLAIAVVLQSASAIILMTAGNTIQLYLYILVYAFGSGTLPLLLAIRADYFGRKVFATITVVIMFIGTLIGIPLSVPWAPLAGWMFDVTRSYQLIFLSSTFLGLIPATIFFFARPPRLPRSTISPSEP